MDFGKWPVAAGLGQEIRPVGSFCMATKIKLDVIKWMVEQWHHLESVEGLGVGDSEYEAAMYHRDHIFSSTSWSTPKGPRMMKTMTTVKTHLTDCQ